MSKEELIIEIGIQKEKNVELYNIFRYKVHEEKMQPLINEWREGSKKLKSMIKELQTLEESKKIECCPNTIFVNGYGEATNRKIECNTYNRQQKRLSREILQYIN